LASIVVRSAVRGSCRGADVLAVRLIRANDPARRRIFFEFLRSAPEAGNMFQRRS
jgi:hypothetical protein